MDRLTERLGAALRDFRWVLYVPVGVVVWLAAALGAAAFVLWTFAELADGVAEGEFRAFDRSVLLFVGSNFPAWLEEPMRLVTALGYYYVVLPLLAVAVYLFYRTGMKLSAVMLLVASVGSVALTTFLKAVFHRARPELLQTGYEASFYSFPSGHATVAVGFYGTLSLLLAYRLAGWKRWTVVISGVALVLLIGFSRLYLGVHYPTDVLAGYLAVPLWVIGVGAAYVLWRAAPGFKRFGGRRKPRNR